LRYFGKGIGNFKKFTNRDNELARNNYQYEKRQKDLAKKKKKDEKRLKKLNKASQSREENPETGDETSSPAETTE